MDIIPDPGAGDIALGETSTTAYRGDRGKMDHDHSQDTNPADVHGGILPLGATVPGLIVNHVSYTDPLVEAIPIPRFFGPTDTLWAGSTGAHLLKSTDFGITWTTVQTAIAGYSMVNYVLELDTGTILVNATETATGKYKILRSTDAGATFADVGPDTIWLENPHNWYQDPTSHAIYACEYTLTNGVDKHVYKSSDDGATWNVLLTENATTRHYHGIYADPYVAGRIWLVTGDFIDQARVVYTDDDFTTVTVVSQYVTGDPVLGLTYSRSRVVGLLFTPTAVFWGADTGDAGDPPSIVTRYDRATATMTTVPCGQFWQGATFRNTAQYNGLGIYGTQGGETIHFVAADLTADNGVWREVFDWPRYSWGGIGIPAITNVDSTGGFVISIIGAQDGVQPPSSAGYLNLYCHLQRVRTQDVQPDYYARALANQRSQQVIATFPTTTGSHEYAVLVADDNLFLSDAYAFTDVSIAADNGNYWQALIRVYRAGSYNHTTFNSTSAVAKLGWTRFVPFPLAAIGNTTGTAYGIQAGDVITVQFAKTGTPAALTNPSICFRKRRMAMAII